MIDEKKLVEDFRLLLNQSFLGETTAQTEITVGEVMGLINRQERSGEWTPSEQKLPEEYIPVLATIRVSFCDDAIVEKVFLTQDRIWKAQNGHIYPFESLTAWQPLPSPYREEWEVS